MSGGTERSDTGAGALRQLWRGLAGIAALGLASFAWLRPTNFRGYDEWLIFWMLSRGIVSFPHANRPLGLVWHLPAWLIAPDRLWGFLLVHAVWLTAVGIFTFLVVRRLLPGAAALAFLAGSLAVAWMPSEWTRIASVQMIQYSGPAAGALAASWLLVEAWHRRRPLWLLGALPLALAAALSLEATLPILGAAPLLLLCSRRPGDGRRLLRWLCAAAVFPAAAGARVLLPLLGGHEKLTYQMDILGGTRTPRGVLRQLGVQLQYHLQPLLTSPTSELAHAGVLVAVLVFAVGFLLATRGRPAGGGEGEPGRKGLLLAALIGLGHGVLGYLPFVLARAIRDPERTEFLAAPGIAVFLAALVALAASCVPRRARAVVACLIGSWIVAVGTGRTLALQRHWDDGGSVYGGQRNMLRQLGRLAPGVEPHSLILLLQSRSAWTAEFTAVKAIEYLYEGRARGSVAGTLPVLYTTRFEPAAVVSEPAAAFQAGWGDRIERYRYDEVLAFGEDSAGRLSLLESWPEEDMGALPPGATYAPRSRIRSGVPASKRFAILDPEP